MGFSNAQFEEVKEKIISGASDLEVNVAALRAVIRTHPQIALMPDFVKDAVQWCSEQIYRLGYQFCAAVKDAAIGIAAPVLFFTYAFDWQDIRGLASNVVGQLKPEAMPAAGSWAGQAAATYKTSIKPQGEAANKIATIAEKTSIALGFSAAGGLGFYAGVGAILAKLIATVVAAIAALGTGVFSWVGLGLVLGEISISIGMLGGLVTGLTAFLGSQAQNLISLHGEAVDNSFFPGGKWPDPFTGSFNDGSVKDGDADWSLNR
ncbi:MULTISPECIES: hypothetical protein [unclassified Crossiella]|uniref:hypothetical protein n=1 Tax=unclassified Crossiella TaxID=2620835 RepID=UPI001FFEBCA9|nr:MULTISPECIES: hypothetical protein [unclassified Crossiella]MCK2240678.1 hypothetical protein [Crossiella sp. S99.2]MCK2252871.1 hypothetical protein [Crossiella sp. S99.1]